MDISLISLENWTKCWIVFLKRAFAHFLRLKYHSIQRLLLVTSYSLIMIFVMVCHMEEVNMLQQYLER